MGSFDSGQRLFAILFREGPKTAEILGFQRVPKASSGRAAEGAQEAKLGSPGRRTTVFPGESPDSSAIQPPLKANPFPVSRTLYVRSDANLVRSPLASRFHNLSILVPSL